MKRLRLLFLVFPALVLALLTRREQEPPESIAIDLPKPIFGNQSVTWQARPLIALSNPLSSHRSWNEVVGTLIYSDGKIVFGEWVDQFTIHYFESEVSQTEICHLLNLIDEFGYFEITDRIAVTGDRYFFNFVEVNSWHALNWDEGEANEAQYPEKEEEWVNKKVENSLLNFRPKNTQPFYPKTVIVRAWSRAIDSPVPAPVWPLGSPRLADFRRPTLIDHHTYTEWHGADAHAIWEAFDGKNNAIFYDEGRAYEVSILPIFPHQIIPDDLFQLEPGNLEFDTQTKPMTCPLQP